MPVTWSQGISGNAATSFGGNKGTGNWSLGLGATIYQTYLVNLSYIGYFGELFDSRRHRRGDRLQRQQRRDFRPRLGVAHVQDHVLRRISMISTKSWMALRHRHASQPARRWPRVSAEEAKQLGTTLTPTGAEKAGNKDGTIPEWTGGLTTLPAKFQKGSTKRVDPFADEKPRLVITGKDVAAHADKLTEGTKELLKRHPTMRVDVYPTHRPVYFPARVVDNTKKNATGAKIIDDGLGTENVLPGYPFPIPKTGNEVMWNHLMNYRGLGFTAKFDTWNVDASGRPTLASTGEASYAWPMSTRRRPAS